MATHPKYLVGDYRLFDHVLEHHFHSHSVATGIVALKIMTIAVPFSCLVSDRMIAVIASELHRVVG